MAKTTPKKKTPTGQGGSRASHGDGHGNGDHHHHKRYRYCKDRDSVTFHLEYACEPGKLFEHPMAMAYDGSFRRFAWCIGKLPCNGKAAVHLYVGGEDKGVLLTIDENTPRYGCDRTCIDFECGEAVKLVVKPVVDHPFCGLCDVNITLTSVHKCKIPKRRKPKCPELAEWYDEDADANQQEIPVFPATVIVELEMPRPLPAHPHISYEGAGVYKLEHGVYTIDMKVGAKSEQSTDVTLTAVLEKSEDDGATWDHYPAGGAAQRFLTGTSGGWMTVASPTPTVYIAKGDSCLFRVVAFRTDDTTTVYTLKNASAIRFLRVCDCPRYVHEHDHDDDDDDGDDGEG